MYFLLPPWLRHGRDGRRPAAVFSVDIQPHGHRLATAGQDAAVNVWSLLVLSRLAQPHPDANPSKNSGNSNEDAVLEHQENSHRPHASAKDANVAPDGALLASVTAHAAAVNCVRWSPQGNLLASGGDDAVVLIYERCVGESRSAAFGGGVSGAENWRVRRPLRAHEADVTDVCWSPDGERLASASIDNTIGIWSVRAENLVARLRGHDGLVKGVAWDPVGRFLASQSDDRSAIVWRTSDWKQEKVLTTPFAAAIYPQNSNVFYLRCSWSPCGTQLLTTNGYKHPNADIAPMFSRTSGFEQEIDLVGHEQPVVATRFSPRLYRYQPQSQKSSSAQINGNSKVPQSMAIAVHDRGKEHSALEKTHQQHGQHNQKHDSSSKEKSENHPPPYTCLALGSKDSGASVWQAKGKRPFFNMREIFTQEVIDISWGSDGYTLVACSPDGGLVYVRFDPSELGDVVPYEEEREILATIWREFGGPRDGAPLPETPVQFVVEKTRRLDQQFPSKQPHPISVDTVGSQVVSKDRSRFADSASIGEPCAKQAVPIRVPVPGALGSAGVIPTPPADATLLASQRESRARGGKRRIIPAAVASIPVSNDESQGGIVSASYTGNIMEVPSSLPSDTQTEQVAKRLRVDSLSSAPNGVTKVVQSVAPNSSDKVPESGGLDSLAGNAGDMRNVHLATFAGPDGTGKFPAPRPPLYKPSIIGLSMMLLPAEGLSTGPALCRAIDAETPPTLLESREQHGGSRGNGHVVSCSKGGEVRWRDYLPSSSPITLLAGVAEKFVAVATSDGFLILYSARSGRRLIPPIALDSAAHMLETFALEKSSASSKFGFLADEERWYVLLVTRSGLCIVYNVKKKKMICARSAAPLLARPHDEATENSEADRAASRVELFRSISQGKVTRRGEPVLILSDGHVFFYSSDLCSWLRIADNSAPNSEFTRGLPNGSDGGLLRSLQASAASSRRAPSLSGMGDLRRAAVETLSHLECLLESSRALSSPEDYRYYLSCYASKLATAAEDDVDSYDQRLRELCDDLLRIDAKTVEDRLVLGMDSRSLLQNVVLPIVSTNTTMQRLVSEYLESIEEVNRRFTLPTSANGAG